MTFPLESLSVKVYLEYKAKRLQGWKILKGLFSGDFY